MSHYAKWTEEGLFEGLLIALLIVVVAVIVWLVINPKPLCDREKPTAGMILDCQATREAATAIADNK